MTVTYKVYRNGVHIGSPADATYTDSGLTNGTSYSYQVSAVRDGVEGPKSATVPATPAVPGSVNSRLARSIADIKALLLDDAVDEIVVVNGTYAVSPASEQHADSLWIGSAYAGRTRPIIVRPQTPLGVQINGNGASYFGGLSFEAGVHDMTWGAFEFINGNPTSTGVVVFGGYIDDGPGVERITIDGMKFGPSIVGRYDGNQNDRINPQDHAVYPSWSPVTGPTDIQLLNLIVNQPLDGRYPLYSAVNGGHPESYNINRMTIRGLRQTGGGVGVVLWTGSTDDPIRNVLIEDCVITGYRKTGIRLEAEYAAITLRDVHTTKDSRYSGVGLYSSLGNPPPGVTIEDCVFG